MEVRVRSYIRHKKYLRGDPYIFGPRHSLLVEFNVLIIKNENLFRSDELRDS